MLTLEVNQDRFRLAEAFTISRGSRTEAQVLTVTISDDNHRGHGECVPYARYDETLASVSEQIMAIAPHLNDAITPEDLLELMPAGAARNAVDCALWDFIAKRTGQPVYELLGLSPPDPVTTVYTLSLDEPVEMQRKARLHAHRPVLKLKLGGAGDIERLQAVRDGAPDTTIVVDANEGWNSETYQTLAPVLLELGVTMVEQPLPAAEDNVLMGMNRPLPVCADESCHDSKTLSQLVGKYDIVNIKLDKTGGLTEALRVKQRAAEQGFGVMVGCMIGSSLAMAPAHLVAQGVKLVDLDAPLLLAEDRPSPLQIDGSVIQPPEATLWG